MGGHFVRLLEGILIDALADFGIDGRRVPGRSGVWVGAVGAEDKIAAIGIRVADGVTMHGFALNCNNSLEPYERIVACGIRDAGVTTMSRVLGRDISTDEDKALASWYWRNLHYAHGEEGKQDCFAAGFDKAEWNRDYWTGLFAHGFGLCGTTHAQWTAEMNALLGPCRARTVGVSRPTIYRHLEDQAP